MESIFGGLNIVFLVLAVLVIIAKGVCPLLLPLFSLDRGLLGFFLFIPFSELKTKVEFFNDIDEYSFQGAKEPHKNPGETPENPKKNLEKNQVTQNVWDVATFTVSMVVGLY